MSQWLNLFLKIAPIFTVISDEYFDYVSTWFFRQRKDFRRSFSMQCQEWAIRTRQQWRRCPPPTRLSRLRQFRRSAADFANQLHWNTNPSLFQKTSIPAKPAARWWTNSGIRLPRCLRRKSLWIVNAIITTTSNLAPSWLVVCDAMGRCKVGDKEWWSFRKSCEPTVTTQEYIPSGGPWTEWRHISATYENGVDLNEK